MDSAEFEHQKELLHHSLFAILQKPLVLNGEFSVIVKL